MKKLIIKFFTNIVKYLQRRVLKNEFIENVLLRDQKFFAFIKNIYKNKRCVIIGNAPSLRVEDLDRLKNEYTFASNKIYLCYNETEWRPTFYSAEDTLFFKQSADEIRNVRGSVKIFPHTIINYTGYMDDSFYFKIMHNGSVEKPLDSPDFPGFSENIAECIWWGSTIIYTQIQMAVHMGFKEIYLLGVDHSYVLPEESEGNVYINRNELNHFHKDYRQKGEKWHKPQLGVLEYSYSCDREFCQKRGIVLSNASRKTALDVIERTDFDSVML